MITFSSGINLEPTNSAVSMNLGSEAGTFTLANNSSLVSGCLTKTARLRDNPEIYGNGWEGSTASGVKTGKIRLVNILLMYSISV